MEVDLVEGADDTEGEEEEKLSKIEKCLSLNDGYTDLIKSFIVKVDEAIELNQKSQQSIQRLIDEWQGEKKVKGANFVPCEPPYFKDSDGLSPSTSELAKEIERHLAGADPLMREATKWKMSEIRMLKQGVRESLVETMIRSFEDRKFDAANALRGATPATTNEELGAWKAALNDAQAEIQRIRGMPDSEIFGSSASDYSSVDWQKISWTKFKNQRSAAQLKAYWMVEMRPDPLYERPRAWSAEEDEVLLSQVNTNGPTDWDEVAMTVGKRSSFQCFERFKQTSLGGAGKAMWTSEEDRRLLEAVCNPHYLTDADINWIKITSDLFPDKNKVQVQGRYERSLDSRIHRGKWAVDEDVQLLRAINKFGEQDWEKIAAQVAGRTAQQCRNRWVNVLDPRRRSRPFLWSELERLVLGISVFGRHDYSRIAMLLPGRNSGDVKARIQAIVRYRIDREDAIRRGENVRAFRLAPKNYDYTSDRRREAWDKFAEAMEAEKEVLPLTNGGKPDFFTLSSDGELQAAACTSGTRQFGERIPLKSGRWVRVARSPNEYDEAKLVDLLSSEYSAQLRDQVMLCLQKTEEKFTSELREEAATAEGELKKFYDSILTERMDLFNEMLDSVLQLEDNDYVNYGKLKRKRSREEKKEEVEEEEEPSHNYNDDGERDSDEPLTPLGGPDFDDMDA